MKIAIDARSLEGNKTGVGRYLENILKIWSDRPDSEFVLYFKDNIPQLDFLKSGNFKLKKLENPLGFSSNFFFQHFLLPYSVSRDRADFFFSPFYLQPFFCSVKSAIVLHDISYEAHPEWFDRKSQFILKTLSKISAHRADIIFTVSNYSKAEVMKYYGLSSQKIIVTSLAPDSSFHREEDAEKIEKAKAKYGLSKFVFCVGTIFTRRHTVEIIDAFEKFLETDGNFQLCVVGKNKTFPFVDIDDNIYRINRQFGGKKIIHLDFLEEDDLMALYDGCAAVIYLSDYEGFGLPIVEAQFFEKPVITSRNTSLVEVARDSVEFVEKNEADFIFQSFQKVLQDDSYRASLISKGKENIGRFSWRNTAELTIKEIIKSLTR